MRKVRGNPPCIRIRQRQRTSEQSTDLRHIVRDARKRDITLTLIVAEVGSLDLQAS
jgi:hypothetical protein